MSKLLGTILVFVRALIGFSTMALWMLGYAISMLWRKRTSDTDFALRRSWLSTIALPVLNIKISVEGSPINEPALYVCNHRSFSDPVIICNYLDAFIIAKAEVANYPIISTGARLTGVMWVNRQDKGSRNLVREAMIRTIKGGKNVLIFPEGTVGKKAKSLDFKVGSFYEVAQESIPVVPIALEYRDEKDLWLNPSLFGQISRQYSSWATECKLKFGPTMRGENGEELMLQCKDWIDNELQSMQKDWTRMTFQLDEKV